MLSFVHVVHIINYLPTPFLKNISPYKKFYDKPNYISRLRVFGCLCYVGTLPAHRKNLDSSTIPSLFLGFKPRTK